MFYEPEIIAGIHTFKLPDNETVTIEIQQKGLDWLGVATWRDNGKIKNIVQCDYRFEHTTMFDLIDDMICIATFGTSRGIDAEYIIGE
jgi:hypothetical protein